MGFQGSLIGVSLVNSEADIRSRVYWPWHVSTRQLIDWVVWLVMQFFELFVESGYLPSVSYLAIKRCPFWELSLRSILSFAVPKPFNFTSPHLTTVTLISWVTGVPFRKVVDRPVRRLSGRRCWLLSLTTWVGSPRIHRMERREPTLSSHPVMGTHKHGVWLLLSCDIYTPVDCMCMACGSFNTKNKQNLKIRKSFPRLIPWSVISYFFCNASQGLDLTFGVDFHTGVRSKDLVLFSWCRYPVLTATFVEKLSFFSNI